MSDTLETQGTILNVLGNNNYLVEAEHEGRTLEVLCHLSGKMRQRKISVIVGDEVTVEIPPPFDKGRITFRGKKEDRPAPKKEKRQKKGRGKRR